MKTLSLDIREQRDIDMKKLRREVDGDDRFMSAHQITKTRTALPRHIPEWTQSDEAVRRFLLDKFPLLILGARRDLHSMMLRLSLLPRRESERGQRQVRRALYTYAVIRLVFRLRLTEKEAARDIQFWFPYRGRSLSEETQAVKDVLKIIKQHNIND